MTTSDNSKVAVIVVHGVAYHAPGASARAAAELLHGMRPNGGPSPYRADEEETVSIPLKQLKVTRPFDENENVGWVSGVPILGYVARKLQERTIYLTNWWRGKGAKETPDEPANEKVANDFMRLILQDYRGVDCPENKPAAHEEEASYVTTCLKLTRDATPSAGQPAMAGSSAEALPENLGNDTSAQAQGSNKTDVHIYELYWSDLTRPDNTILSFIQGLYQMLFHLASLSRLAISTGVLENRDRKIWRVFDWTQLWAVRMLTLPIPILNVILFIALFGALPHLVLEPTARWAATISAGLLGLLGWMIASPRLPATRWPLTWAVAPVASAGVFAGVAWLLMCPISPWWMLALEGWVLGAAIIYLSSSSYDDVRDGAKEVAWTLYGLSLATFLILIWCFGKSPKDIDSVVQATLWMMQFVLAALRVSWILLFLLAVAALILGSLAWRSLPKGANRARAKAAVRASRFALAMPSLGILIVTLALWSGLFVKATKVTKAPKTAAAKTSDGKAGEPADSSLATKLFGSRLPDPQPNDPKSPLRLLVLGKNEAGCYLDCKASAAATTDRRDNCRPDAGPWWQGLFVGKAGAQCSSDCTARLEQLAPNDYFQAVLVWSSTQAFPLILVVVMAGNFLLVLWLLPSIFAEGNPPRGSDNASSKRMGAWLSRGLDATAIAIVLFWTAAFLLPLAVGILHEWWPDLFARLNYPTALILEWLGVVTGSLAILASVAKSGSSVLGIILDVDNYLRTSPKEKTPRARIVERYVSLLRYVADDRVEERKYDRIVILAHSLGSLITGDMLLFLKTQGDPGLGRLGLGDPEKRGESKVPIRLFTMGDPARQFLNRFFPYLYEWVRETPDNTVKHLGGSAASGPDTVLAGTPEPARLGVQRWVNAYRSGDYIGRSLWLNEWYSRSVSEDGAYPQKIHTANDGAIPPVREEMCIGAGAHQHYWDQSAPDIAEKLDELIR